MIIILLAAYQGQAYIAEQITSIQAQTYQDWQLIVQDDCSTDDTCAIVAAYAKQDARIKLIRRDAQSGGAKANFSSMLRFAQSEYCMFCDQDDIWLPDKIALTLDKMLEMEASQGKETPILVHTDLTVVDRELKLICVSLIKMLDLDARRDKFNQLLVQNIVTGCSTMANAALLRLVDEVPDEAIMHDWWFALVAAAFGGIGFIEVPTVLYRQHGGNEVGAKNVRSLIYILKRLLDADEARQALKRTYEQAGIFEAKYQKSFKYHKIAHIYNRTPTYGKPLKLYYLFKYGFSKKGIFRTCGQIVIELLNLR